MRMQALGSIIFNYPDLSRSFPRLMILTDAAWRPVRQKTLGVKKTEFPER
jgi:hypothetical protein